MLRELGKTLRIRQQPETTPSCRVCNAAGTRFLCDVQNEHSETSSLQNYRCQGCGSVFVGNPVDSDELGIAYGSMDADRYFDEIEIENKRKMRGAIERLDALVSRSARLLDVGAGNGQFIELLDEAGYSDLSAHEIPGGNLSKIGAVACEVYEDFDYSLLPSNTFDVVTLLDVVEHVIEPQSLVDACARVLKPDGLIYFHTPVVTRIDRLMHHMQALPGLRKVGAMWQRGRTSIFHLENYTPGSLTLILERAGFRDIEIETKNELSWPVERYIRTYMMRQIGLPAAMAPVFVPILSPLISTNFFNANKAIVQARLA
ncbi:MAG: class I SAM-dependent methyltransferase [Deltaproteobacteria bacterium]|nr:class I SAM-dependent methyltransferase [Deltaproteobacteria bacterium]